MVTEKHQTNYLNSSLAPYAKIMSLNSSKTAAPHEFIRFKAEISLGFVKS